MLASLDRERSLALDLARSCGALALSYQTGGLLATRDKPNDEGPVTRADTEVNARILDALRRAFPDDDVIGEESSAAVTGASRCWYVDPIDGTTEFARGEDEWAVQIGLCIDGEPVLGVVHEAGAGRLAWGQCWRGELAGELLVGDQRVPLRTRDATLAGLRLVSSKSHASPKIREVMHALAIADDRNLRIGSMGVKMTAVARGVADLYVHATRGTKLWDVCAPHVVLLAAGGQVSDVRGQPLRYDPRHLGNDHGLLATQGSRHRDIVAALAPVVANWTWT
ncbi:3'(2'),5'-bisphosphate nucleotidase CysQ [Nannocystis sp.]|uniref:3'(2'),5'-bisphosphate nucleotidase CysQ family protein n=1 Tax=Nannocystis sp. TaxID=1962667 RepID=UPI0024253BB7|nr:3'(2'),5'-bisphosphate nucleotidase CysQ [Nannocystis sp.]MBK7829500.1 3'(2'),5'-bisphosphate nucleotidase CysQ [Nannocystis sp.]MBK9754127.1 3'(2'),5'-bisphosphate nucleotidase CysQ [Nannocystis sp.]